MLLEKRTIFYLDFLPKILEDVINHALLEALPPESEGQFAYQKKRSTDLCVAIGLHRAEVALEHTGKCCLNVEHFDSHIISLKFVI